jgi:hypothetical protein
MRAIGIAILGLVGLYVYLDGTGAAEATAVQVGFAAGYVALMVALLRE